MKRILALVLTALMGLSLLAGCAAEGEAYIPTGDGLTWDDPSQATGPGTAGEDRDLITVYTPDSTYNPYLSNDLNNRTWMSLIYQGLFAADSSYQAHPILCDRYWMSDDMQTYVFYLRSDATFSDGTPVTVEDVEASLAFALESTRYRGRFSHVESMFAADGAITFRLDTPYEDFPLLLDVPILKQTELTDPQPLGSGPYRLTSGAGGMRLVRVATWWCSGATLPITGSAVVLREGRSPLQIRDDFERSDVELVCSDPGNPDYAAYRCDYELWDCETGNFLYLSVNMASWIFGSSEVRLALSNVINREQIVEEFYHGYARPATLCASPLSPYYDSILSSQYGSYDPERFTQAVQAQDLGDNTVKLLVNSADAQRVSIARRIETMLENCGLPVDVVAYTGDDYLYTLSIRNYDLHLGQTTLSPNMDLSAFFGSKGALSYGLSSTRLYALCLDSLANRGNYYNLHKEIAEDGRLVPILFGTCAVYGKRGAASSLTPSRGNVFYYDLGLTAEDIRLSERRTGTPE